MQFGVTENPTMDWVLLYNNADLISKVSEEIASEIAEKLTLSTTPLSFDATSPENLREYPHKPFCQKAESLVYICAANSMDLQRVAKSVITWRLYAAKILCDHFREVSGKTYEGKK